MGKRIFRTVEAPEGVDIAVEEKNVSVKGPKGELVKELTYPGVSLSMNGRNVEIRTEKRCRINIAVVGTFEAHIKNMIRGVTDGYKYTMKAVFSHFPITIKQNGDTLEVHNFLGEKVPRKAKVLPDVKVNIQKDILTIEGSDKEKVGQSAANIEQATKVQGKDVRVFQDGVYITGKE